MKNKKFKKVIAMSYSHDFRDDLMQDLGISKGNAKLMRPSKISNSFPYHRVFTSEERAVFSSGTFGYLFQLLKMGSISKDLFEELSFLAYHIGSVMEQKVGRAFIDDMLNELLFSEKNFYSE